MLRHPGGIFLALPKTSPLRTFLVVVGATVSVVPTRISTCLLHVGLVLRALSRLCPSLDRGGVDTRRTRSHTALTKEPVPRTSGRIERRTKIFSAHPERLFETMIYFALGIEVHVPSHPLTCWTAGFVHIFDILNRGTCEESTHKALKIWFSKSVGN